MAVYIVHSLFLLFSGVFCLSIAGFNKKYCLAGDFCKIVTMAFFTAAFVDFAHSASALNETFLNGGVELAWLASRIALVQMLLMVAFIPSEKAHNFTYRQLAKMFFIPQLIIAALISLNLSTETNYGIAVLRPFEFLLSIGFLLSWYALWQRKRFKYCFPLGAFNLFIGLGVAIHFIIGFYSHTVLDSAFMVAELLKLIQYGFFSILLINMISYFEMKEGFVQHGKEK